MVEELATIKKINDEIEFLSRLESIVKLDDERVGYFLQNQSLRLCILLLLSPQDHVLLQGLHRKVLLTIPLLH